jgi:chemotaxis family two-component system response regulator Rcp1
VTQRLQILLIEDNEGDVEMVRAAIDDQLPPCGLVVARDGKEALDYLIRQHTFQSANVPQLIFLDLNMPRMDGKILLRIIKQDERFSAIPVVVLTSSRAPSDILGAYGLHANCYLVKPFDGKAFRSAIEQVVNFWRDLATLPCEAGSA